MKCRKVNSNRIYLTYVSQLLPETIRPRFPESHKVYESRRGLSILLKWYFPMLLWFCCFLGWKTHKGDFHPNNFCFLFGLSTTAMIIYCKLLAHYLIKRLQSDGTSSNHDYVTSNVFSSYDQFANQDYEGAFKKAHPGKDANAMMEKTGKARDLVKSELWELVMTLN